VNVQTNPAKSVRWPVYLVIAFLIAVTLIFLVEFVVSTEDDLALNQQAVATPSVEQLEGQVAALFTNANPERGAVLVEQYGCVACHREGAPSKIAPPFQDIAERAANRRSPLTAAAYLYESVISPLAYVVEGFNPAMPQDYATRLSDQELGDIIAYLLTPAAH
jgi:cytochrome c oxidase subunit 2